MFKHDPESMQEPKIPHILKNSIQKAVSTGSYLNSSDFVRDAIKEKLQREGFVGEKQVQNKIAKEPKLNAGKKKVYQQSCLWF